MKPLYQGLEDGRLRDLRALTAPDFELESIVFRLAKINRFAGATRFPLSVTTHSMVVAYLCPPELALTGLLHDITEAFGIGDMISPIKALMPEYRKLEREIWEQLCVPFPALARIAEVDHYDKRATALEAFMHRRCMPDWAEQIGCGHPPTRDEKRLCDMYYSQEIPWLTSAHWYLSVYDTLTRE